MGSYLSNLQLGFGWMEDLGLLLVFLHLFFKPTDDARDTDIIQSARESTERAGGEEMSASAEHVFGFLGVLMSIDSLNLASSKGG
jgi:hypothetical protein